MVIQGLFNYANAYNGSLSLTSTSGAYATFNFAGIKVRVYGTVDPGLPPSGSTYSIAKPPSFPPLIVTSEEDSVTFFESAILNADEHQLVITVTNVSENNPYLLDFLLLAPLSTASDPGAMYTSTMLGQFTSPVILERPASNTPVGAIGRGCRRCGWLGHCRPWHFFSSFSGVEKGRHIFISLLLRVRCCIKSISRT